jgi:hypothetical protein
MLAILVLLLLPFLSHNNAILLDAMWKMVKKQINMITTSLQYCTHDMYTSTRKTSMILAQKALRSSTIHESSVHPRLCACTVHGARKGTMEQEELYVRVECLHDMEATWADQSIQIKHGR